MIHILKRSLKNVLNNYVRRICRAQFETQKVQFNERPVEYGFLLQAYFENYPAKVLDVGTGDSALPFVLFNFGSVVTAIDNIRDYWPNGMVNRHWHVLDDDIRDPKMDQTFDMVTCISVLEHISDPRTAVRNMFSLLNPGGHLVLTCPYSEREYIENVYELPDSTYPSTLPYGAHAFSRNEVDQWLEDNEASLVKQDFWRFWDGKYWTVGNHVIPPTSVGVDDEHQLSCMLFKKNG